MREHESTSGGEGQGERERERETSSMLSTEPNAGLNLEWVLLRSGCDGFNFVKEIFNQVIIA